MSTEGMQRCNFPDGSPEAALHDRLCEVVNDALANPRIEDCIVVGTVAMVFASLLAQVPPQYRAGVLDSLAMNISIEEINHAATGPTSERQQ